MNYNEVLLGHGGGGLLTNQLVSEIFLPLFSNSMLDRLEDGAVFELAGKKFCFSTDSYVINPIFFPGGNIGSLAVHGTVNDLAMCGGRPLFLSAGFIIEEGLPMDDLRQVVDAMAKAARAAGVQIVTGDTKVVARGAADKLFINTAGIGIIEYPGNISTASIRPGDSVIVSGFVGDHGAAILSRREGLGFESDIRSDSAPLNGMVQAILKASPEVHCMRDATRGGVGTILAEIAGQAAVRIEISEEDLPVRSQVRGVCEILGLDPLFLANEGKMVTFCAGQDAEKVLAAIRANPYGQDAAIIGRVSASGDPRLIMQTAIGGQRQIDIPAGELIPRIC